MKLVDLKRTKKEIKETDPCTPYKEDPYGYGLRVRLDKDQIEKLGLETPKAGDIFKLEAVAMVRNVSIDEGTDRSSKSIEFQIKKMGLEKQSKSMADAVDEGIKDAK